MVIFRLTDTRLFLTHSLATSYSEGFQQCNQGHDLRRAVHRWSIVLAGEIRGLDGVMDPQSSDQPQHSCVAD